MSYFDPVEEADLFYSPHLVGEMVNSMTIKAPDSESEESKAEMKTNVEMDAFDGSNDSLYGMTDWSNYGFRWLIDCFGFEGKELGVEISPIDGMNVLTVYGEKRDENGTILRSMERQLGLSNGTEIDHIRVTLLNDGILIVETPFMPIDYQGGKQVLVKRF